MKWTSAWSYLPIDYGTSIGTIENITQRTIIKNNVNGNRVKVKFTNRYGTKDLVLEEVVIGSRLQGNDTIDQMMYLTYNGQKRVHLQPGEEFYSDEIEYHVEAGCEFIISIYIKEKTEIESSCSTWAAQSWWTRYGVHGNYTKIQKFDELECRQIYPYVEADENKANIIVGISDIMVASSQDVKNITLFGDSITHMSYYSDALKARLDQNYPGQAVIVNRGIGGNRILNDASYLEGRPGEGRCFGIAAMKRYVKDLYEENQPDAVLILEGVNDIMHPYVFHHPSEIITAAQLIEATCELIMSVKQHGAKAYLATIMPFYAAEMPWFEEAEAVRTEYNEWVRSQKLSDGILDFAKELSEVSNTRELKEELHIGDGLHPNTAGGNKMAAMVPVKEIIGY